MEGSDMAEFGEVIGQTSSSVLDELQRSDCRGREVSEADL